MISSIVLSVLFAILSLTVNVNSQICSNAAQYTACSLNSGCACLSYSFSNTTGVCGLVNQSCSLFSSCLSPNDGCAQTGYICVRHPRCSSNPICYPPTSFDQNACPRVIVSNYTGALDSSDGRYTRPGGSGPSYYEAIQVVVDRTGYYNLTSFSPNNMDTHGYIYNGTFYPLSPSVNMVQQDDDSAGNNQFRLPVFLEAGVPYTLVVAPHNAAITGSYSVVASGPGNVQMNRIDPIYLTTTTTPTTTTTLAPVIMSNYSNALTVNSGNFTRYGGSGTFYYHAVEVRVPVTGNYTFKTSSTISDTYGYLYQGNFYPTLPQYNIVKQNDDAFGNAQFGFTANLRSDITYILVFTTYGQLSTGNFTISASGPSNVYMNPISV